MKEMRVLTVDDAVALQMENELLAYEVRHLRARLAVSQQVPSAPPAAVLTQRLRRELRTVRKERDEALGDLQWVLGRLDRSAMGLVFRRYGGFRALRARYLGSGH